MGMPASCSRPALVLVATAHPDKRDRWVDLLSRASHRVLEAIDGVHGLAMATRHLPDITIADVVLPKLDGLQLTARLAASPDMRDIPTILVRDPALELDSLDDSRPIVANDDDLLRHLARLLAQRTTLTESRRTLRRALADIRASAQEGIDDAATINDRARQMASSTDESMISVLVADDNGRYVEANRAVCALSGYSRERLLEMSFWDLSVDDAGERGQRNWKRFLRDGRFEGSFRIRRSNGEIVTIRCTSAANVVPGLHVATMAPPKLLHVLRTQ
jgi:PAS domain S-box-containing protein